MEQHDEEPVEAGLGPAPLPWDRPGILVGVDGSQESLAALRTAADLGPKLGLPVHVLAVWDYPVLLYAEPYYAEIEEHSIEQSEGVLADALAQVFGAAVPPWCTHSIQRGSPARILIERSRESAIVAVGSRGHGGFAGLLLGSVSASLTSHAECSVLIVR